MINDRTVGLDHKLEGVANRRNITVRPQSGRRNSPKLQKRTLTSTCATDKALAFESTTPHPASPGPRLTKKPVTVPARSVVEAEFTAMNPGKSLFHCHLQDHMDSGFMTRFDDR
ncbi:MAG: multicopper oxidase domain-containing protein [Gemmatimonadaceae bacterium]